MTLEEILDRLGDASLAARELGLVDEANRADDVLARARDRSGFSGAAYVLALAGGTGVGKSSLLNALAGHTVSAVRAVRPTTDQPIAWVADARRDELAPLLAWLGVRHVAGHADGTLSDVAIVDLPDVDSVRTGHRATVDALLPRIDAVAWVLDPEKYDDERLHGYLRTMAPHASRLRFILNKADRLTESQRAELVQRPSTPAPRLRHRRAASRRGVRHDRGWDRRPPRGAGARGGCQGDRHRQAHDRCSGGTASAHPCRRPRSRPRLPAARRRRASDGSQPCGGRGSDSSSSTHPAWRARCASPCSDAPADPVARCWDASWPSWAG